MVIDVEIWILAIVPLLAAVAVVDTLTHFSTRVSAKLGVNESLWVHLAALLLVASCYFGVLSLMFDFELAFAIVDYLEPRMHWPRFFIPHILVLDGAAVVLAMLVGPAVAIYKGKNVALSIVACLFGSIGTIVWLIREQRRAIVTPARGNS